MCIFIPVLQSFAQEEYFNPLPTLETEHLILRNCEESDAPDLFEVQGDPEVVAFTPMECDEDVERTEYWIQWRLERQSHNEPAPWLVEHKEDQKAIGLCGFCTFDEENETAELLSTFHKKYDDDLMDEAVTAAVECGFTMMNLNRINFYFDPHNTRATAMCKRFSSKGLQEVGLSQDQLQYKGAFWDRVLHCLLRKNWVNQKP